MPWVAALALVGTLSIAGLPPLNGFVSEWLLLQSFLFTPQIPHAFINMLIPLGAAALALTAALAAYVMVKFYGVIFLGQPREASLVNAHDANWLERLGLGWLGVWAASSSACLPQLALRAAAAVTRMLLGQSVASGSTVWWIAPIAPEQASYSGLILLVGIVGVVGVTFLLVRLLAHGRVRRTLAWDCGYPWQTAAHAGHGRRLRSAHPPHVRRFLSHGARLPSPSDIAPRYRIHHRGSVLARDLSAHCARRASDSRTPSVCCKAAGCPSICSTAS